MSSSCHWSNNIVVIAGQASGVSSEIAGPSRVYKTRIEYFDMPEAIRDKYQYFTQANLDKLKRTGINHKFFEFPDAVRDYAGFLKNHSCLWI